MSRWDLVLRARMNTSTLAPWGDWLAMDRVSWGRRCFSQQARARTTRRVTPAEAANLNITVTGTSSSGSGFFDPGAGFTNHISASVSGSGVTVNTVAYTDPTHVTLDIDVAANATTDNRTITVTNPDGQSTTSA